MTRWSVDIIRKRAERLGTVTANTEKEAIAAAIKRFEIEPARQNRIAVSKISNKTIEVMAPLDICAKGMPLPFVAVSQFR